MLVQCLGEGAEGLRLFTFSDPDFLPKEPPLSGQRWPQSATPSSASTSPCSVSGVPGIRKKMPASLLHFSPEEIWTPMLSLEADQPLCPPLFLGGLASRPHPVHSPQPSTSCAPLVAGPEMEHNAPGVVCLTNRNFHLHVFIYYVSTDLT